MKTFATGLVFLFIYSGVWAQRDCRTAEYEQQQLLADPSLKQKMLAAMNHSLNLPSSISNYRVTNETVIKIPVVVHVLYNKSNENISMEQIQSQIDALNRDFRKKNADIINIPERFAAYAADIQIEFELAKVDPKGRATSGVVRKYTPVTSWTMNDDIKFSETAGSNAWDAGSYLNIWVGNLSNLLGYASVIGDKAEKDGVVIATKAFGTINTSAPFNLGRTAVHEVGHWLGLKHIWGDAYCGDDLVDDTPQQRAFTSGCPTGVRVTCGSANGDMYMNYMDFTNDACMYLFTQGQKERMRSLVSPGGFRHSLLASHALGEPWMEEIPVEETPPNKLQVKLFPNPASSSITIDLEYDARWIGKELQVINMHGQVLIRKMIQAKTMNIDIHQLQPGLYFVKAEKEGGRMVQKFVKQ